MRERCGLAGGTPAPRLGGSVDLPYNATNGRGYVDPATDGSRGPPRQGGPTGVAHELQFLYTNRGDCQNGTVVVRLCGNLRCAGGQATRSDVLSRRAVGTHQQQDGSGEHSLVKECSEGPREAWTGE